MQSESGVAAKAGDTRSQILGAIASSGAGCTVEALADTIGISRSGVRQQLTLLERDGLVARKALRSSGGRPELQFSLTEAGRESFPRQYSWFSDLLIQTLAQQVGPEKLGAQLAEMGVAVGKTLTTPAASLEDRLATVVARMKDLGYDARAAEAAPGEPRAIEASNCVFHKLAERHPQVCRFDIAMLEESLGTGIDHEACMVRGDAVCRFRLCGKR